MSKKPIGSVKAVMVNRKILSSGLLKNLKLGHKFFLSLMAISIVPLAVVSIFNYHYSKSQLQKSTIGNLRVINDSRAIHINHLIQLRQEQAKELAGTFISRQLQAGGFNDREVIRLIQAQIDSIFNELKFTPTSHYKNIDQASDVENISIWDIHGNVIADTNKEMVGKRMPFEFLQILYDKGAYFGGFEKDSFTGENYLTILEEIRSLDSHEYAGVLFIKTNAKILNDITTAREGFGKTAETYLVDKERRLITESRFIKDAVLKTRVNTIGVDACFSGRKAPMIYKNYQGHHVLGVQKYLPDQEWCISTEMDVREAFEPTSTFRNQIFFIVGCLVFLIYIFVHLAGRAFIQPILALRDASKEVAKGNYNLEVNLRNQDELGELSGAFNEMTKNLSRVTSELEEKNKRLQHLDQVKSEFVSTVSHELRTPMTIIRESISQVLNGFYGSLTELQKNMLSMAHNNIDRLGRIINNLLDISKIEDGKIALNKETVDLVVLAREVGAGFDSYVGKKGLAVKYEFSDDKIEGYVDKDKIIQAFTNLIGNAVKFTMKGHITVSVTKRESYIECFVADTGRGIAAEDLPKVFGKFQQFGRPSGTAEKGTGLGLTISKGLVELHGGKIWLESKLDEGTKFIFTLPYPPKA